MVSSAKPTKGNGSEQQQFTIENRPGKGRCMIALRTIPKGQIIHPPSRSENSPDPNYFEPLVPPVLMSHMRSSRCAVCFGRLKQALLYEQNPHDPRYVVLLCSSRCREEGMAWLAQEERSMVNILSHENDATPMKPGDIRIIFPSAVLAYRICLAMAHDPTVRATVESLQKGCDGEATWSAMDENARTHALASILTVKRVLFDVCVSSEAQNRNDGLLTFGFEAIFDIIGKTRINAFSICDGEFTPLGLGIYPIASNMNHSCRPNALQTFRFGAHKLPELRITTCSTIPPQEEICISYIDVQAPRHERQLNLASYGFDCTCPYCTDEEREDQLVGLKCQKCGGKCHLDPLSKTTWRCKSCQEAVPERVCSALQRYCGLDNKCSELKQYVEMFRKHCFPSSWYFQHSASSMVDLQVESMYACPKLPEKKPFAHAALQLLDTILETQSEEDCTVLITTMLRFKAAKLRLFLVSDILRGIQELKEVEETLLVYYPPEHEIFEEVRLALGENPLIRVG